MTKLAPGAATMTVVFTDLVGSTALRTALGDDRADALRREHDQLVVGLVHEQRGVDVKGTGDGILAVFHAPSEALAAVIEIQQAISRRNRRAEVPLSLRIGVSIGEVRVENDDVFGTPVVEAARLCNEADDDQILASVHVKALVGSRSTVKFDEVGPLELKGLDEPLLTYAVRWWESGAAQRLEFPFIPALAEPFPFVGRALEQLALADAWSRARSKRGPVVFVGGEPGVGKTRLAAQFARRVHDEGAIVLYGHCRDEVAPPFEPFVEALRAYAAQLSDAQLVDGLGEHPGRLVRLVPELAGRVVQEPASDAGPKTESLRLFDAVASWLAAASRVEPVVFLIDDLHWNSDSTIAMLRHVLLTTDPMRVLVLVTFRGSDARDAVLLTELRENARAVEHLQLGALDEQDVRRLVESSLGGAEPEVGLVPLLVTALVAATGGNPLHVDQALRYLVQTGQLLRSGEGVSLTVAPDEIRLPASLSATIIQRLELLDQDTVSTVKVASVLGPEVELAILQALLGVDDAALGRAIGEAVGAGLLTEPSGRGDTVFSHVLIRDAIQDSTEFSWRAKVHRRAAETIERQAAQRPAGQYVLDLAHHYTEAAAYGDPSGGIESGAAAARYLLERLAYSDARRWYRSAKRLLESSQSRDDGRRLDLLVALGETEALAGRREARETLTDAAELAARVGDSAALLQAAQALRVEPLLAPPADGGRYVRTLYQALDVAGHGDPAARARLLALLAFELSYHSAPASSHTGSLLPHDAGELADQALDLARSTNDRRLLLDVVQLRIPTIDGPSTLDERVRLGHELSALAEQLDEPIARFRAVHFLVQCHLERGDLAEVEQWMQVGRVLLRQLHLPVPAYVLADDDALRALLAGDLDDADRADDQRRQLATVVGLADRPEHVAFQYAVRLAQGQRAELDVLTARLAVQPTEWLGYTSVYAMTEAGADEAAERYHEAAALGLDALGPLTRDHGIAASNLAFLAALHGDLEGAERWYAVLEPFAEQLPRGATMLHCGAHYLGMVAALLNRSDDAHRWFEHAVGVQSRIPAPLLVAETQLEWARFCSAIGEVDRARELAEAARLSADERRARGLEGQARGLLHELARGGRRHTRSITLHPFDGR